MLKNSHKLHIIFSIIIVSLAILLPLVFALRTIMLGTFPFWYDPARDLLLALNNLHKITLIGPTSGIPGIFYGPYWIWWLSFPMLFSKDPRWIDFIVLTLPYFTIFPFILYKFSTVFTKPVSLVLWLLFILSFSQYTVFIWNPHLAPLLVLSIFYLLTTIDYHSTNLTTQLLIFFAGALVGLLLNFHISFGSALLLGSYLFFLINIVVIWIANKRKNTFFYVWQLTLFTLGIVLVFIPFFLFEVRHQFMQIRTLLTVLATNHSVVSQKGFSSDLIVTFFFGRTSELLQISSLIVNIILLSSILYGSFLVAKKKVILSSKEWRLLLLITTTGTSTLVIYLLSKNPVWNYHFIAIEVIFLLLLGVILKHVRIVRVGAFIWVTFLLIKSTFLFVQSFSSDPMKITSFVTQKAIVDKIYQDANRQKFAVFAYNPAIYTYEYDYLFASSTQPKPASDISQVQKIYLIIPPVSISVRDDFIHYRIPNGFTVTATWHMKDKTEVIKAEK